jgi:hypothetical protein
MLIVIAGKGNYGRLAQYLNALFGYNEGGGSSAHSLSSWHPVNYSFAKTIYFWLPNDLVGVTKVEYLSAYIAYVIVLIILVMLWYRRKVMSSMDTAKILIILASFGTGTYVAGYYTIVYLPILLFSLYGQEDSLARSRYNHVSARCHIRMTHTEGPYYSSIVQRSKSIMALGLAVSIVPILIPYYSIQVGRFIRFDPGIVASLTPILATSLILAGIIQYLISVSPKQAV